MDCQPKCRSEDCVEYVELVPGGWWCGLVCRECGTAYRGGHRWFYETCKMPTRPDIGGEGPSVHAYEADEDDGIFLRIDGREYTVSCAFADELATSLSTIVDAKRDRVHARRVGDEQLNRWRLFDGTAEYLCLSLRGNGPPTRVVASLRRTKRRRQRGDRCEACKADVPAGREHWVGVIDDVNRRDFRGYEPRFCDRCVEASRGRKSSAPEIGLRVAGREQRQPRAARAKE